MAQTVAYSAVAAALLSGHLLTIVEWGAWTARGVHWAVWGQSVEDARLQRIVREVVRAELMAQHGRTPEGRFRFNTPIRRDIGPRRLEG